jgi:hypothetical protein
MKHRFLNIFLILVLLTQVLPVKQMGELLFNNQLNEEINYSDSGCKEINKSIESSIELEEALHFALILASSATQLNYSNFQDCIPSNHVFDVNVPPPNC